MDKQKLSELYLSFLQEEFKREGENDIRTFLRLPFVREAIVTMSTSESFVQEVLLTDNDEGVQRAAIKKLKDQRFIVKYIGERGISQISIELLGFLTKESLIKELFEKTSEFYIRELLLNKISDDSYLASIADDDTQNMNIRKKAIEKLKDEDLLICFRESSNKELSNAALNAIDKN